jgi:phosphoribosylformylglycinamidine cyclo-ligase
MTWSARFGVAPDVLAFQRLVSALAVRMSKTPLTYKDAGVDIDAGDDAVERIGKSARSTHIPGVLSGVGGFGGLFALKEAMTTLEDPVLVSGTDGVGTKLLVAIAADKHDTIGQDLVAMCVNDVLTSGARPLFFLDYFATGALSPAHMATVVDSIARACKQSGCALIGGETAELPGMYQPGHYDLAGFTVGAVERKRIVDGARVSVGDSIIGLASSGLHSNGFSLARAVVFDRLHKKLDDVLVEKLTVKDVLLQPTRLYVKPILDVLADVDILAMAHITGGGLPQNLTRAFPPGTAALIDERRWPEPPIFDVLRQGGPIETDEMRRTFNCGIGFCVVVGQQDVGRTLERLRKSGEAPFVIGEVVAGDGEVRYA